MKFPIIHIVICFIIGVYLNGLFQIDFIYISICLFICFGLLYIFKTIADKHYTFIGYRSIIIVMGVLCGMVSHHTYNRKPANHISHFLNANATIVSGKIKTVLKSSDKYHKYIIEVDYIEEAKNVNGQILVYISITDYKKKLLTGDRIYFYQRCMPIPSAQNPNQFDYANYMKNKRIYHQVFLKQNSFKVVQSNDFSIFRQIQIAKNKMVSNLKSKGLTKDELGIMVSLVMGDKSKVSKDLLDDYSKAGAIHILAVSGLHVGIVYFIISTLFSFLRVIKNGNYILLITMLITMWGYAVFTGLSPSVTRAVVMLSFVAIGKQINRATNIYNTLAISAFLLLLYNPNYLFDVGFQLSYLAVFSIVYIHRIIGKIYTPKHKIVNYFWQLTSVSVAVQIGTFPISIYYFHQFPTLFMITNWVLVPIIGIVLFSSLFISILSYLDIGNILFTIYGYVIKWMNLFVSWVASLEDYMIKDVYFDVFMVALLYIFIHFAIKTLKLNKVKSLYLTATSIICIQGYVLYDHYQSYSKNELIVFHKRGSSIVGIKTGHQLKLLTNYTDYHYTIKKYELKNNIKKIVVQSTEYITSVDNANFLMVEGTYIKQNFIKVQPIETLLLKNSTNYDLNDLIQKTKPKLIIADGSNSFYSKQKWKKICRLKNIEFYDTDKNGFFRLEF